jgi:hypothetical protein
MKKLDVKTTFEARSRFETSPFFRMMQRLARHLNPLTPSPASPCVSVSQCMPLPAHGLPEGYYHKRRSEAGCDVTTMGSDGLVFAVAHASAMAVRSTERVLLFGHAVFAG